jgi:hypothetical protein
MRRATATSVVLAAALASLVAACFSKPGAPHFGDGDGGLDDGRTDVPPGSQDDGGIDATSCTSTDTFTSGSGCGAIGASYGPANLVGRQSGQLSMAATGSAGGCRSSAPFSFANGTSIKVVQLSESAMVNTTSLRVTNGANASEGMEVIFNDAMGTSIVFDAQCLGGAPNVIELPYDSVAQLYWKFEAQPSALGGSVHAFYSGDGASWTDIGAACPWSSVATVSIDIGVGATAASSSQLALFDDFNVKTCP